MIGGTELGFPFTEFLASVCRYVVCGLKMQLGVLGTTADPRGVRKYHTKYLAEAHF